MFLVSFFMAWKIGADYSRAATLVEVSVLIGLVHVSLYFLRRFYGGVEQAGLPETGVFTDPAACRTTEQGSAGVESDD